MGHFRSQQNCEQMIMKKNLYFTKIYYTDAITASDNIIYLVCLFSDQHSNSITLLKLSIRFLSVFYGAAFKKPMSSHALKPER